MDKYQRDKIKDLLNEYVEYVGLKFRFIGWNRRGYFTNVDSSVVPYERVFSKDYNFIAWLVDMDKVDYEKAEEYCIWNDLYNNYRITRTDALIACIAIQEKPIDFLYNILR